MVKRNQEVGPSCDGWDLARWEWTELLVLVLAYAAHAAILITLWEAFS